MNKKVKYLIPAFDINMGGVILKQALPTQNVEQVDPFLLLHHGTLKFNNKALAKHQGIGPHPHRGFSPVTFIIDGELQHRDSRGHNQIAKKGEVQWMHAGAGIVHSERPSQALVDANESVELIQLWINSPAESKMKQPLYQHIHEADIPTFSSNDGHLTTKLIAGNYEDQKGKIQTESDLLVLWSNTKNSSEETYTIPKGYNSALYLIKGEITVNGFGIVDEKSLVVFENDGDKIQLKAQGNVQFLILSGKPLNEKVVQQGPFVMNSQTQILEAMRDYQMGKMGVLIEET